ncbi:hypothetical protein BJX62DRAFT_240668 [Aspergillus germanicus]
MTRDNTSKVTVHDVELPLYKHNGLVPSIGDMGRGYTALVEHGADIHSTTAVGENVFHAAACGYFNDIARHGGQFERIRPEGQIGAQDETIRVLQAAAG